MNNPYNFIFPGQGSQFVGMSAKLLKKCNMAKEHYLKAKEILGFDLLEISLYDKENKLNKTEYTQPAIFLNSVIKDKILKNNGCTPQAVSGHSLGEYSALVSCEVLSFEAALKIIKIRAKEMQKSGDTNAGGMLAILGATEEQIDELCNSADMLVPANYNSNEQVVLSGNKKSINETIKRSKKMGLRKIFPLKTSGAFHSPLMKSARNSLSKVIKSTDFKDAKMPIYQNTYPFPEKKGEKIKNNLLKQLESPVYWTDIIKNMIKDNDNNFIEVGPGNVLSKLVKRISKNSTIMDFYNLELIYE
ncbi:MAG: [acyl-carrier-protein] S-malonyltransferase [Candidatus Marinimicrobia bacterium]|nr:[acyl-carrier-protein] S-malonyltransferase [Candidatus Neomarinimicrobiota bacterium]|tara:strand:- start:19406 stop:20314 length:909 start_codon:yes stop_codon:yes gene_type:complete